MPETSCHTKLANWVRGVRERKGRLLKKGINVDETPETVPPGELLRAKTLTVTRLEQLDAIGFVWQSQGPKTAWEVRFRDCMEYYTANNGKWPSQSMGSLGGERQGVDSDCLYVSVLAGANHEH